MLLHSEVAEKHLQKKAKLINFILCLNWFVNSERKSLFCCVYFFIQCTRNFNNFFFLYSPELFEKLNPLERQKERHCSSLARRRWGKHILSLGGIRKISCTFPSVIKIEIEKLSTALSSYGAELYYKFHRNYNEITLF